jgi:hypothetical protein
MMRTFYIVCKSFITTKVCLQLLGLGLTYNCNMLKLDFSISAEIELVDNLLCGRHDVLAPHQAGQVDVLRDLSQVERRIVVLHS